MASIRVILAITAGNCSWIVIRYFPVLRRVGGAFFGRDFPGNVGGSFDFRFSFGPNATCAFREGVGPRAVGFSVGRMIGRVLPRNGPENQIGLVLARRLGGKGGVR
jgi:hypothetical protein